MDDSMIVDLYLSRDESAISLTAEKYGSKLRKIAYGILGSESSAEECENETYLEAWSLIPPHEPRTYLFPFLGKIIRQLAIDEYRKATRKKRSAPVCELTKEMQECIPGKNDVEEAVDAARRSAARNGLSNCEFICGDVLKVLDEMPALPDVRQQVRTD